MVVVEAEEASVPCLPGGEVGPPFPVRSRGEPLSGGEKNL
jgi:hypothetical protein